MSDVETFDAILIGTGQAAPALANRLNGAGWKTAVIERGLVGGTCVNTGCTPTKTMVASAHVARLAARAAEYGVVLPGPLRIDMPTVHRRVAEVVESHRSGLERWLDGMEHVTLIRGHARFEGAHDVRVGDRRLRADRIFINVGARALVPPIDGIDRVRPLTNSDMVRLEAVPRHLIVIGGSYIGLEFAQMFRRFGAEVSVIEKGPRLIAREDEDISDEIRRILEREGIAIHVGVDHLAVRAEGDGVAVDIGADAPVVGSHLLVAVGRVPNTDDLGLDAAGIDRDARGYIRVDDALRTNVDGVFALGDCNGRGAFTHTSYDDYEIAAANLLDGGQRSVADRVPAYALYIDPPLGRAGMTVAEAKAKGHRVRIGERPMSRVARAVEKGEPAGLMRVVVDADSDEILGGAVLGPGGDEAIHEIIAAMRAKTPAARMAETMAIHPTVSELIPTIFGELSAPQSPEEKPS